MSTTLTINANRSALVDWANPTTNYSTGTAANLEGYKALLVGFSDAQLESYPYRSIESAILRAYVQNDFPSAAQWAYGYLLAEDWTEGSVTWETRPDTLDRYYRFATEEFYSAGYKVFGANIKDVLQAFDHGVMLSGSVASYGRGGYITIQTSRGSNPPQLNLTLSDEDAVPSLSGSPSGGYVNKHAAITLKWNSRINAFTFSPIAQTDATLRWREGSSGTVHEIGSLGELTSYTLAADAVSGSELRWQVSVTYNSGAVVTSPWYVCSTVEALSTAEIVRPKDTLVDASQPITLEWRHVISTGTAQTAADLQTSTDGSSWTDLAQVSGAANTYVVAAGAWTGGTRWWRVRTYNTDDAPGAWSEPAQISVVGGPSQPVVACTSDPRPVISWQADRQQGFEAEIGGQSSGVVFGTDKSWQPPEFLPDGPATARVRVVNSYGLWSDWGEVGVTIANPGAGAAFTVTAYPGREVGLTWNEVSGASAYWIYRNGDKIAETEDNQFVDRWSNGENGYKVRAIIGEGYRDSAEVSASVQLRYPVISALDGDWIELRYSTEPVPTMQNVHSRPVSLLSVQGSVYPVAEVSPHRTRSWALQAAFLRASGGAAALGALLGREVVYKDQFGHLVHGVMAAVTTSSSRFYDVCSAQLQEVEGSV